jgi:hypothetical protein
VSPDLVLGRGDGGYRLLDLRRGGPEALAASIVVLELPPMLLPVIVVELGGRARSRPAVSTIGKCRSQGSSGGDGGAATMVPPQG